MRDKNAISPNVQLAVGPIKPAVGSGGSFSLSETVGGGDGGGGGGGGGGRVGSWPLISV
jgi:hypothetical protein